MAVSKALLLYKGAKHFFFFFSQFFKIPAGNFFQEKFGYIFVARYNFNYIYESMQRDDWLTNVFNLLNNTYSS